MATYLPAEEFLELLNGVFSQLTDPGVLSDDEIFQRCDRKVDRNLFNSYLSKTRGVLLSVTATDFNEKKLELFFESQSKKKDDIFNAEQLEALRLYCLANGRGLRDSLTQKCRWNDKLRSFEWRVDVNSVTNEPSLLVSLQLEPPSQQTNSNNNVIFEMKATECQKFVSQLSAIDAVIRKNAGV